MKPILISQQRIDLDVEYKEKDVANDTMKNEILYKYGLPLLRFRTDGSSERERLTDMLNVILK